MYESLNFCPGQESFPGIQGVVYFLPKRSIVSWPKLPSLNDLKDGDSVEKIAKYEGSFVLAADKKWRKMDVVMEESPVSSESQGEIPSKSFINKATIKLYSAEEDATAFIRMANSDDLVFVVFQKNGKSRVIGSKMFTTSVKPTQELGSTATDKAGTTLEIEATDKCPAPFYVGKIEAEDGDIDGATGDAWVEPTADAEA
jgi:hypothetical protein